LSEKLSDKLSERELDVLRLIVENRRFTSTEIAEQLGVSRQIVTKRLKTLKEKNIIRREGSDKKGHWEIIRDK